VAGDKSFSVGEKVGFRVWDEGSENLPLKMAASWDKRFH
jgi:hypothetical protein